MTKKTPILALAAAGLLCVGSRAIRAEQVSTAPTCDGAKYAVQTEVQHQDKRFALVRSCAQPGSKAIVRVADDKSSVLVGALVPSDPGIEKFEFRSIAGHTLLVYENAVEPTGDEETHYIAIVDASRDEPRWLGDSWSFSNPELFVELDAPYLGVSVNPSATARPEAMGWPLVFAIGESGLTYVPLSTVPAHACGFAKKSAAASAGGSDGIENSDLGLTPPGMARLMSYCSN